MADTGLRAEDVSRQAFGKYQHCTMWRGKWYADSDFGLFGRPKLGAKPRAQSQPKHKWPFCEPDGEGVWSGGMNANGTLYQKSETSPGVWRWVIDEEGTKASRDHERSYNTVRDELWWALRTRVLSEAELERVRSFGSSLNVQTGVCYNGHEKAVELNNALARQAELRILAERAA